MGRRYQTWWTMLLVYALLLAIPVLMSLPGAPLAMAARQPGSRPPSDPAAQPTRSTPACNIRNPACGLLLDAPQGTRWTSGRRAIPQHTLRPPGAALRAYLRPR